MKWTARIAPLGVPSVDRRALDPTVNWGMGEVSAVPLLTGEPRRIVGWVRWTTVADQSLWARGDVDDDGDVAERMQSGELRPAVQWGDSTTELDKRHEIVWRRSGTIVSLAAVPVAAWGDACWFVVDGDAWREW